MGTPRRRATRASDTVIAGTYAALGALLAWSRLAGLDGGFCCDEISTVVGFVREGPREILAGPYIPNNHELFSLLAWATSYLFGESEVALRLLAAAPFIAGVVVATAWLHVRLSPLSGVLFLLLATISPLLLDITRLARGYGLAFLAMSVMLIAALETRRAPGTWWTIAFFVAGVAGSWTLPHFTIAFVTIAAVLLAHRPLRTACFVGSAVSLLAIIVFYAPHIGDIVDSSEQSYGIPIRTAWVLTAVLDQTLVPALSVLDETLAHPSVASLVFASALGVVMAFSPLLRRWDTALIVAAGVVVTIGAFWLTGTHVVPRFFSFLLVPLFMLLASGAAAAIARARSWSGALVTALALAALAVVGVRAAPLLAEIPRTPRESLREVAAMIEEVAPTAPVVARMPYAADLRFHLGRPVLPASATDVARACANRQTTVFVVQEWLIAPVSIPCVDRPGTRHYRFTQYARGEAIDVWVVPPRSY